MMHPHTPQQRPALDDHDAAPDDRPATADRSRVAGRAMVAAFLFLVIVIVLFALL